MASPQKEHGFTPIANELLRALIRQPLPGRKLRVWLTLAIDSYGKSRKETTLSISEISAMTGIDRREVSRDLRYLLVVRMTLPGGSGNSTTSSKIVRRINKDYDTWVVVRVPPGGKGTTDPSGKGTTTPRTRVRKKRKEVPTPSPTVRVLIDYFHERLTAALGERPMSFNGGVLGRLFKRSILSLAEDDVKKRIDAWFGSDEPFIVNNGFSPTMFVQKFSLLKDGPLRSGHSNGKATKETPSWM